MSSIRSLCTWAILIGLLVAILLTLIVEEQLLTSEQLLPIYGSIISGKSPLNETTGRCRAAWKHEPIIIGGMSDAGTRGVFKTATRLFDVKVCNCINKNSNDAIMIKALHNLVPEMAPTIGLLGRADVNLPAHSAELLNSSLLRQETFRQWARNLCAAVKRDWKNADSPQDKWGFKAPRSLAAIPIWNAVLPDHKFLHVI